MSETFMKEQPILPLLASMALPMVLSMLVNSLYNIVDSFFVAQISELTGWNLDLADEITSGKGGMTVSFAETSSLVSGPPETQDPDFFVYDSHQLVRTILDSVQHTLQYNFVDPSLGDPSSLDIYFNLDGEAIVIPDSGETIDPYAPYEPQTEG